LEVNSVYFVGMVVVFMCNTKSMLFQDRHFEMQKN